uniref:Response regulator n=1 Tax=Enterococcus faecalis TaxID=1351 RepID=Q9KHM3_ENTFL|nr:response regulator [Enterococcus faecalis]
MRDPICIADDDRESADIMELHLERTVMKSINLTMDRCRRCAESEKMDLAMLDVMLPDVEGFHICQKIREGYFDPTIMRTAKEEDADKNTGLTIGADDYITKPFIPVEVAAGVKTQLRRHVGYNNAAAIDKEHVLVTEYDINGLVLHENTHKCTPYGKAVTLTPIEFSVLCDQCENQGKQRFLQRMIKAIVWGEKFLDNNNTVMAHIGRLREKLKEPARNPKFIKTVWGVGYTIEE